MPINSIGACRFDSHSKIKITLKIYLKGSCTKIHILDSNFESIYSKVIKNLPSDQKWFIANISDANVRIKGDFYVGVEWIDPELRLGVDNEKPYFDKSYLGRLGSSGNPKLKENYMIRSFTHKLFEYDVFIAYYQKTGSDFAKHLKTGLGEQGYNAFLDVVDIPKSIQPETTK